MTKHKWHKEIKAWADGKTIQARWNAKMSHGKHDWHDCDGLIDWDFPARDFRIKPQPKKPQYLYVFCDNKGEQILRTHTGKNSHETYIGKIKLEVDDD